MNKNLKNLLEALRALCEGNDDLYQELCAKIEASEAGSKRVLSHAAGNHVLRAQPVKLEKPSVPPTANAQRTPKPQVVRIVLAPAVKARIAFDNMDVVSDALLDVVMQYEVYSSVSQVIFRARMANRDFKAQVEKAQAIFQQDMTNALLKRPGLADMLSRTLKTPLRRYALNLADRSIVDAYIDRVRLALGGKSDIVSPVVFCVQGKKVAMENCKK